MTSSLHSADLIVLESVDSTQRYAAEQIKGGEFLGGVLALEQTEGKGRFGRKWHSPPGECLAVSLVFTNYAKYPRPYLIGMSLAVACARAFRAQVQWPNDVVIHGRKLGGILTELLPNAEGQLIPVVGVGLNLNQSAFDDEIADVAISLVMAHGLEVEPTEALARIMQQFETLREVQTWSDLAHYWERYDATEGKRYTLNDGRIGIAKSIGPDGELICDVDGHEERVLAADALMSSAV